MQKHLGKNYGKQLHNGLNLYKLVWVFVLGAILGSAGETLIIFINTGRFYSRQGVIYVPISPIYGFGMVILTVLFYRTGKRNFLSLFLISSFMVTSFEYISSWLQEIVTGTRAWSYGNFPFNLDGRVCLYVAILWGIMGVLYIKFIYPRLDILLEKILKHHIKAISWCIIVFLVFDLSISTAALKRQAERWQHINSSNVISDFLDKHYPDERMKKIYTSIRPAG